MSYVIQRRQIGDYVTNPPYAGIDNRYTRNVDEAQKFSRYVDAFNAARGNETVREL